ncbi:MAG: hypothetical protein H0Z32_06705 [Bacillaceae bacterium]|nr:hypothetical protein [Bacillaceae bacterium]
MNVQNEYEKLTEDVIRDLKKYQIQINERAINVIASAMKESYDTGYEHGLMDGKEISDKPISG